MVTMCSRLLTVLLNLRLAGIGIAIPEHGNNREQLPKIRLHLLSIIGVMCTVPVPGAP